MRRPTQWIDDSDSGTKLMCKSMVEGEVEGLVSLGLFQKSQHVILPAESSECTIGSLGFVCHYSSIPTALGRREVSIVFWLIKSKTFIITAPVSRMTRRVSDSGSESSKTLSPEGWVISGKGPYFEWVILVSHNATNAILLSFNDFKFMHLQLCF